VDALRALLSANSVLRGGATRSRLETAIVESRRGEAQLSAVLGERVRQAVEKLIQCSSSSLDSYATANYREHYNEIYLAATRLVMRCVVVLFAEARELLPVTEEIYHRSYGIQGLREQLEHTPDEVLSDSHSAWSRLVALFRLLHEGSDHGQFPVVRYGGRLFEPGNPRSDDPVSRSIAVLEASDSPSDLDVKELLTLLSRTYTKLRQRRGARPFSVPVNFSAMDTEYIGILYEGLLDFNLRRVGDDPIVILRIGDYPVLPWSRLSRMDDAELEALLAKLKQTSKPQISEDGGDDNDGVASDDSEPEDDQEAVQDEVVEDAAPISEADALHARVFDFAVRAVKLARLVPVIRGKKTAQRVKEHEEKTRLLAKQIFLIKRPGEWYLVRFGNTRKGSGTFYTRPQLTGPTVRRTLRPLCYDPEGNPRRPDQLLELKVCDPAMGSGSFLISALRYLTDALLASLYHHNRIEKRQGEWICRIADGLPAERIIDETAPVPAAEIDAEERLEARLRRYVVERCLYGVDIDEMAVELGRMALWIETMHRELPFGFLDHKIKGGNSLIGCWFDRFEDYPATAWLREGGDKGEIFIDRSRPNWTEAIAARLRDNVKPSLQRYIALNRQEQFAFVSDGRTPLQVHDQAMVLLDRMHQLPAQDVEQHRQLYRQMRDDPAFRWLSLAFDGWCALWFWPGDRLETSPLPTNFAMPEATALEEVARIRASHRMYQFFHWELEFPDAFGAGRCGFDAVVGNPPWEIQKPSSKEFFSNIDPLYRGYGKTEAEAKQKEFFCAEPHIEHEWLAERARLKALSNWVKNAGRPFGDYTKPKPNGTEEWIFSLGRGFDESADWHSRWKRLRHGRHSYADLEHPFRHQGSADINTYKMFLEAAYRLLRENGRLGFLVPSAVYSDQGSTDLRALFLEQSQWEWLFGFENREKVFDIDTRFKFAILIIQKGGQTSTIRAAFMHRSLSDWEDGENHVFEYPKDQVVRFSPGSKALLEIRENADLQILKKVYKGGRLLGGSDWGVRYAAEFHLTNDAKKGLFRDRPKWEAEAYLPDEYGHWLAGLWRAYDGPRGILDRPRGMVLSRDGAFNIEVGAITDVALPLYEGRMIGQFDFCQKGWISGKGRAAKWDEMPFDAKLVRPQFLMGRGVYITSKDREGNIKSARGIKLGFMDISSATNERTMIAALIPDRPCGNKVPVLGGLSVAESSTLCTILDSFAYDYQFRQRLGANTLNWFIVAESCTPTARGFSYLSRMGLRLACPHESFANAWLAVPSVESSWRSLWAVTPHERLRLRCVIDAVVAQLYELTEDEFRHVLRDCDHPAGALQDDDFTRRLDPKGFWRVDKEKNPELRHTVLSLVAFQDLQTIGPSQFVASWELPKSVCLAEYRLGKDDRAQAPQPVSSLLGPRFHEWQLAQPVGESWEECKRHAELLERIIPPASGPTSSGDEEGQVRIQFID
jgi:hypothetical protein